MAMTLRLSDAETDDLRRRAEQEGTSMHEVARKAIRLYVCDRAERLNAIVDEIMVGDAELLERLGS
jgi:predicted transcriptional regulator